MKIDNAHADVDKTPAPQAPGQAAAAAPRQSESRKAVQHKGFEEDLVDILVKTPGVHRDGQIVQIPIKNISADNKVDPAGVQRYVQKIRNGEHVDPITVVKQPSRDAYVVLDGHHRFHAFRQAGAKDVDCVVIYDAVGLVFSLTKRGLLQPPPAFTKYIRTPLKQFSANFDEFVRQLREHPDRLKPAITEYLQQIASNAEKIVNQVSLPGCSPGK